MTEEINHQ